MDNSSTSNTVSKSDIKEFFNKPMVRALILGLVDVGLVVYTALVSNWTLVTIIILIVLGFIDLIAIVYYGLQSVNYRATIEELQKNNSRLLKYLHRTKKVVKTLGDSCDDAVVRVANGGDIGPANIAPWDFTLYCQEFMKLLYGQVKGDVKSVNNQVELSYIEVLHDDNNNLSQIQNIACITDELCEPSIYNRTRDLNTDPYLDAEYVLRDNPRIQCITSHDELRLRMQNRRQPWKNEYDLEKYNQIFFVPVLCPRRNLVGVLVITCLNGTVLAESNEKAEQYIFNTIVPYLKLLAVYYGFSRQTGNEV